MGEISLLFKSVAGRIKIVISSDVFRQILTLNRKYLLYLKKRFCLVVVDFVVVVAAAAGVE